MSTDCLITFDHSNNIYHSGETLNGYVKLVTEKSKSIRAISIKIVGYVKVFWSESRGKSSTNFTAREQYLNSVNYVLGSPEGESFDLQPGIYEYTFACHLPEELPTSVTEAKSKIKYKVIVTIDRRLRFDNVFQKEFIINQIADLNLNSNNKLPKRSTGMLEIAPFFGFCCLTGTDIKAELLIPCQGYVPGQTLPFHLIIYNDSSVNLSGAKVKLLQCFTYQSTEPYIKIKEVEKCIDTRYCRDVPRNTNKRFKCIFNLPFLPPTNRTRYMCIDYKIKAKINVFGYSTKKFHIEVPVTIGTVPIRDFDPMGVNLDDDKMEYTGGVRVYSNAE